MQNTLPNKQYDRSGVESRQQGNTPYRTGLAIQVMGAGVLAVLYPLNSPFYSAGIMLFASGALLSAATMPIERTWIKTLLAIMVLGGVLLAVFGMYAAPQYAGAIILTGIVFISTATAGIAGREAFSFSHKEGWVLAWLLPAVALANLFGKEHRIFNIVCFSALFLLLLSILGKKLRRHVSG